MKIAYIILAHDDIPNVLRLANRLLSADDEDIVVVHWDKKGKQDIEKVAGETLNPAMRSRLHFSQRIDVGWGEYSMIEATLAVLEKIQETGLNPDYVVLLSGADYPIRSTVMLKQFLEANNGKEFIECVDPKIDRWVKQGLSTERYEVFHYINWRPHPKLFTISEKFQKKIGIKRKMPLGLQPRLGSQWWALTWKTLSVLLAISKKPQVKSFFKRTWVPDEMYFQTLVHKIAPTNVVSSNLTFYHFDDSGKPLVFYNDHYDFLLRQPRFFARKISPYASWLRDKLDQSAIASTPNQTIDVADLKLSEKDTFSHKYFNDMKWEGLPGRRIIGKQNNPWRGDLEWNRQRYFVVIAPPGINATALQRQVNALPGVILYGDLFASEAIDYNLPGKEHPLYPADKIALRDFHKTNFLNDIIHYNRGVVTGFIQRSEKVYGITDQLIWDKNCKMILLMRDDLSTEESFHEQARKAFHIKRMEAYLPEAEKAGKKLLVIHCESSQPSADVAALIVRFLQEKKPNLVVGD
jgi:hypothetical protein